MNKNPVISENVAAIQASTGCDARYLPDIEAAVSRAHAAGCRHATHVEHVAPLTEAEIAALRESFRAQLAKPAPRKRRR